VALISWSEGLVPVEYGQFFITTGSSDRELGPMYSGNEDFLEVGEGSILCISAWNSHEAVIRFEYWSTQPPGPIGWELEQTTELRRGAGPAYAVSLMGRTACELDLDIPQGHRVQTRIACAGRAELLELAMTEIARPSGVERWLAQFWRPSAAL
jgi:hypothetical protein